MARRRSAVVPLLLAACWLACATGEGLPGAAGLTKQDAEAAKCAFATTYGLVDVLGPLSGCSSPGASPSPTAPGATPLPPGVVPPPPAAVPPTPTSQPPTPPPAPGTAPPTSGPSTSGSTPLPSAPAPVVPLALYAGSRNSQNNSALARLYLSDGTWIPTGNLITGRVQAAAVRLQSGKVLITSGIDANGNALSSCELWDPLTNAWTPTGSLSTSYYAHHIVLLANGQVLVAGTDVVFTSATDVFDPNTGVWTLALMPVTRAGSTLSLVPGDPQNRALLAGGYDSGDDSTNGYYSASYLLFDPATYLWTAYFSNEMSSPRFRAGMVALLGGSTNVLVAGGQNGFASVTASADLFSVGSGPAFAPTGNMTTARQSYQLIALPDGTALAALGQDRDLRSISSAKIWSQGTGWSATGSPASPRVSGNAVLLSTGQVLLAGGATSPVDGVNLTTSELYTPALRTWINSGTNDAGGQNGVLVAL